MGTRSGSTTVAAVIALTTLVVSAWAGGAPGETLFAGAAGNLKINIGEPGGACRLDRKDVRDAVGLPLANASNPVIAREGIPALAVTNPRDQSTAGSASRLVVVDRRCRVVQVLRDPYRVPAPMLYETMLTAMRFGYFDIQADNGQWGAWNLRTNVWDPAPCCDGPPHGYRASVPSGALAASPLWAFLQPAVWAYAIVVTVFALLAIGLGYRGMAILGQAMVVLPFRTVWLAIVLVVAVNIYAIAGLFASGALSAIASGTIYSATRAWRR